MRIARATAAIAAVAALALASARQSPAAPPPYETNDSAPAAFGPLVGAQPYAAAIEAPGDRDYFFFYVTSPRPAQVTLTVENLGGAPVPSNLEATILDSSETPLGALPYIGAGESRSLTLSLEPQKYFLELAPAEGYGDSYGFTVSAAAAAIGPYGSIAGRCAAATAATAAAQAARQRAEAKLQRATARLRRSRYAGRDARRGAHAAFRAARARVGARAAALRAARESQEPWCSIPQ